ncbi:MAG: hypothetical protein WB819_02195, partial [Terriglobia bacterium]
ALTERCNVLQGGTSHPNGHIISVNCHRVREYPKSATLYNPDVVRKSLNGGAAVCGACSPRVAQTSNFDVCDQRS